MKKVDQFFDYPSHRLITYIYITAARLTWAHAVAHCERWKEELNCLKAEAERIPASFKHEKTVWNQRSGLHKNSSLPSRVVRGYAAYAHKQAAVYQGLQHAATHELRVVQQKVVPIVGLGGGINPFARV